MPCAAPAIWTGCGPGTSGTTGPRWRHSSTVDPDGDVAGCPRALAMAAAWFERDRPRCDQRQPVGKCLLLLSVVADEIPCRTLQLALGGTGACLGGARCSGPTQQLPMRKCRDEMHWGSGFILRARRVREARVMNRAGE